jgi:hypothetical protein
MVGSQSEWLQPHSARALAAIHTHRIYLEVGASGKPGAVHVGGLPETSNFYCHPGRAGGSPQLFRMWSRFERGRPELSLFQETTAAWG